MLRAWAADEPPLLSRPISVHHYEEGTRALSFLFQVKGPGTRKLAALRQGNTLPVSYTHLAWLDKEPFTKDGVRIDLGLNIGSAAGEELEAAQYAGFAGLLRTRCL